MKTRYAMREDLPEVLEMYLAGLEEIKESIVPINAQKCADVVLGSWLRAPCILLEKNNEIIGFAGLCSYLPAYSDAVVLREYLFYIKPGMRGVKAAKALSDAAQAAADELKLPLFMSHMVFDLSVPLKEKFLKKWGYDVISLEVRYG